MELTLTIQRYRENQNTVNATMAALNSLKTAESVAKLRGKSVEEIGG